MLWVLLTAAGLVAETALIVVLGQRAIARDVAAGELLSRSRAAGTAPGPLPAEP